MKVNKVDLISSLNSNAVAFSEQDGMKVVEGDCGYILLSFDQPNADEDSDAGVCLKVQLEGLREVAVVEGLLGMMDNLGLSDSGLRCIRDYARFLLHEPLGDSKHVH